MIDIVGYGASKDGEIMVGIVKNVNKGYNFLIKT